MERDKITIQPIINQQKPIMQLRMKTILGVFVALGAVLISCNDSNTPGTAGVQLEMKATASISKISASGRSMATGAIFRQVLLGVTELEFESAEENQVEAENDAHDGDGDGEAENEKVEYHGSYVVDLIKGTSTPDFGIADLLPGTYEEMEINVGPVLDSGKSILVAFDIPRSGADTLKIEFSTSAELQLELERDAGFQLDGGALNQMLVLFNLDSLIENIDFSQAVVDADGIIRINEHSNTDLALHLASNFYHSMEAGEDHDHNEEIDED